MEPVFYLRSPSDGLPTEPSISRILIPRRIELPISTVLTRHLTTLPWLDPWLAVLPHRLGA